MNMKSALALMAAAWLLAAPRVWAAEKLPLAVSIPPLAYFAEKIGGDRVAVSVLVGPGADPHTFEPRPGQMAGLSRDRALITVGAPFERAWVRRFLAVNPELAVISADEGLARIPMEEHGHGEHGHGGHEAGGHQGDHGAGDTDPHVWLSPRQAPHLARNIFEGLCNISPENRDYFKRNFEALEKELSRLNQELDHSLSELPCRRFMVFHPSWGYFAHDFGLSQIPIETGGTEPGPADLARALDQARKDDISVIFTAPQFSRKSARTIAREINANLAAANPLPRDWPGEMRHFAAVLVESCGKKP